jgi:hypothetical protein
MCTKREEWTRSMSKSKCRTLLVNGEIKMGFDVAVVQLLCCARSIGVDFAETITDWAANNQ